MVRLAALLPAVSAASLVAQSGFTATWEALEPVVVEWVTAPAGTPNARRELPAGTLPAAPLNLAVAAAGFAEAVRFTSAPMDLRDGEAARWLFTASAWAPPPHAVHSAADLRLTIAGPMRVTGTVEFRLLALGDWPSPAGFRVDVGDDGSFEFDAAPLLSTLVDRRASFAWDFDRGPLQVRVQHRGGPGDLPQFYGLETSFRPWQLFASSEGDDCGNTGASLQNSAFRTNYHLAVLPPLRQGDLALLRATGIGDFGAFLLSGHASTVPFQLPGSYAVPCPLLTDVVFTTGGGASLSGTTLPPPLPVEWVVPVPPLPVGLDLYVQHASLNLPWFGSSNRVRIRT